VNHLGEPLILALVADEEAELRVAHEECRGNGGGEAQQAQESGKSFRDACLRGGAALR